jgi:hypothetical protein
MNADLGRRMALLTAGFLHAVLDPASDGAYTESAQLRSASGEQCGRYPEPHDVQRMQVKSLRLYMRPVRGQAATRLRFFRGQGKAATAKAEAAFRASEGVVTSWGFRDLLFSVVVQEAPTRSLSGHSGGLFLKGGDDVLDEQLQGLLLLVVGHAVVDPVGELVDTQILVVLDPLDDLVRCADHR